MELYDLACGLVYYGALTLTLVVPYFGYSTMERVEQTGEVITAKSRALLFSSIPQAKMGNEIFFIDLHSGGMGHYFEGSIRPFHLNADGLIEKMFHDFDFGDDVVIASTDAGRAKWIQKLSNILNVPAAFVYKKRSQW